MPALDKVQDYVTAARQLLQDTVEPYRYPDADIVDAMNIAFLEARRLRADLFYKNGFVPLFFTAGDLTQTVSFNPQYRNAVLYFIVGHLELRDDESTTDSRAAALIKTFTGQLLSIAG